MLGSSFSVSGPNVALMTILAEAFDEIATRLEKSTSAQKEVVKILKEYYTKHKRIIFDGNNYAEEWVKEAEKRGYHFNPKKIEAKIAKQKLRVTQGQLGYEFRWLCRKLKKRSPRQYRFMVSERKVKPHPFFRTVQGTVEGWERVKPS